MPSTAPDSNPGNNATITMSREDLMALSVKKLKHLLKERDLPAGHAAKSALVDRLLEGKKKAPKSNAERKATSRATRSQERVVADRALNAEQVSAHRATRSEEQKKADRALNTEQVSAHRATRSQAKVVADRALNTPPRLLLEFRLEQLIIFVSSFLCCAAS